MATNRDRQQKPAIKRTVQDTQNWSFDEIYKVLVSGMLAMNSDGTALEYLEKDASGNLKTTATLSGGDINIGNVDVVSLPNDTYSATSSDVSTTGDNTIVSITNTPKLYYVCLSADGANSADVTAIVKIGSSSKFKVSLKPGAIWARNIGAGRRYLTGSAGDDVIVNLSTAQTVYVSVEYEDI